MSGYMLENKYFSNDLLNIEDFKQQNSTLTDLVDFILVATTEDINKEIEFDDTYKDIIQNLKVNLIQKSIELGKTYYLMKKAKK